MLGGAYKLLFCSLNILLSFNFFILKTCTLVSSQLDNIDYRVSFRMLMWIFAPVYVHNINQTTVLLTKILL